MSLDIAEHKNKTYTHTKTPKVRDWGKDFSYQREDTDNL